MGCACSAASTGPGPAAPRIWPSGGMTGPVCDGTGPAPIPAGPVLLVPSLINRSHIWDLRPGDSFVEGLLSRGYDVFLIDWGTADERDSDNTMSTYVDHYLPAAYAAATRAAGSPPAILAHCFGGVIATLWAATVPEQPPALVALGVPTNWAEMGPLARVTQQARLDPEDVL